MEQSLALRFDRIVNENLAKRKEMMEVMRGNAIPSNLFCAEGNGVKTILSKTGRLTDFKGIYGFLQDGKFVFIDESSYVIRRIVRQYKGNSKYQMKLASIMTSLHQSSDPEYQMTDALKAMEEMQIVYMDVPDDLERQLTTLYLQCQYECRYNRFE